MGQTTAMLNHLKIAFVSAQGISQRKEIGVEKVSTRHARVRAPRVKLALIEHGLMRKTLTYLGEVCCGIMLPKGFSPATSRPRSFHAHGLTLYRFHSTQQRGFVAAGAHTVKPRCG